MVDVVVLRLVTTLPTAPVTLPLELSGDCGARCDALGVGRAAEPATRVGRARSNGAAHEARFRCASREL
jgi:hypothetical protein